METASDHEPNVWPSRASTTPEAVIRDSASIRAVSAVVATYSVSNVPRGVNLLQASSRRAQPELLSFSADQVLMHEPQIYRSWNGPSTPISGTRRSACLNSGSRALRWLTREGAYHIIGEILGRALGQRARGVSSEVRVRCVEPRRAPARQNPGACAALRRQIQSCEGRLERPLHVAVSIAPTALFEPPAITLTEMPRPRATASASSRPVTCREILRPWFRPKLRLFRLSCLEHLNQIGNRFAEGASGTPAVAPAGKHVGADGPGEFAARDGDRRLGDSAAQSPNFDKSSSAPPLARLLLNRVMSGFRAPATAFARKSAHASRPQCRDYPSPRIPVPGSFV